MSHQATKNINFTGMIYDSSSAVQAGITIEEELDQLRKSAKLALISNWKEIESLRVDLESSQAEAVAQAMKALTLEQQLCKAKQDLDRATEENRRQHEKYLEALSELDSLKTNCFKLQLSSCQMTGRTPFFKRPASAPIFLQSPASNKTLQGHKLLREGTKHNASWGETDIIPRGRSSNVAECGRNSCSSWTTADTRKSKIISSNATALGSIGSIILRGSSGQSTFEEDLMKQLAVLEKAKKEMELELEFKLHQREAAISTLEQTTQVQAQIISELRNENDRLVSELTLMVDKQDAEIATQRGTTMVALLSNDMQQSQNDPNVQQENLMKHDSEKTNAAEDVFSEEKKVAAICQLGHHAT